jgi:hypothetical protein
MKAILHCLPDEWVWRHITGRDYGVDVIVELVEMSDGVGYLPGNLVSVQAKGVAELTWRRNGTARIAGIKKRTVTYWMNLPMPVFLCVYEASTKNTYFTDVKRCVRANYGQMLQARKTVSFEVLKAFPLNEEIGLFWFVRSFLREMAFPRFADSLKMLITHERSFSFLQQELRARPREGEVDEMSITTLISYVHACQLVSSYLGDAWKGPTMKDVFQRDARRLLRDGISSGAVAWGYDALEPHYQALLKSGKQLVTEVERQFWATHDAWLVKGSYSDDQRARNQAWRESDQARLLEARLLKKYRHPDRLGGTRSPKNEDT